MKHIQHSSALSIPANLYPNRVHQAMQTSASFEYGPPSRIAGVDRVLALFASLFAKRRHPSQVRTSEQKNVNCVCLLVASHEEPIARVLNHDRRRLGCVTVPIKVKSMRAATVLCLIAGACGRAIRDRSPH